MIRVICMDCSGLGDPEYQMLYDKASDERRIRADRYRHREDALRCVAAEALLRYALGTPDVCVARGTFGKPCLEGREDLFFNLSHAGIWVVLAIGDSDVGVDVERLRGNLRAESVARRFFAPDEQKYVFDCGTEQPERFLEIWTAKESYLKYLGTGLQKDLTSFSVFSLEPEVKLHGRMLPGGYFLSLCTTDEAYRFELLDGRELIRQGR